MYMSIGMTYDQYWNEDPMLCKYYRKADNLRRQRKNEELWLQGMYVYEAILDASPVLHAYAKAGTKPAPYPREPYPLTEKERVLREEREQKEIMEKGRRKMLAMMNRKG